MHKRLIATVASSVLAVSLTSVAGLTQATAAPAGICKEITVLTNRTDIAPTTFKNAYGPAFTNGLGKGTKEQLIKIATPLTKSGYGTYLLKMAEAK